MAAQLPVVGQAHLSADHGLYYAVHIGDKVPQVQRRPHNVQLLPSFCTWVCKGAWHVARPGGRSGGRRAGWQACRLVNYHQASNKTEALH